MQVYFTEPAAIELDDAFAYYELQLPGLGRKFFNEDTGNNRTHLTISSIMVSEFGTHKESSIKEISL